MKSKHSDFSKIDSSIVKGVAIIMMLFHHSFLQGRWENYNLSILFPFSYKSITDFAWFCKICVSMFVFVTGYGLYKSISNNEHTEKWIINRYIKSFSGYWFVMVCINIIGSFINRLTYITYFENRSLIDGALTLIFDFIGIGFFFGNKNVIYSSYDSSWWYMSALIVFIILIPVLYKLSVQFGHLIVIGLILIFPRMTTGYKGGEHFATYILVLFIGMLFAKYSLFNRIYYFFRTNQIMYFIGFMIMSVTIYIFYKAYIVLPIDKLWEIHLAIIPTMLIIFIHLYVARFPVVKNVLRFLGEHSMNIFLIHTIFLYTYCGEFMYSHSWFGWTIVKLLIISLLGSALIERTKHITGYNALIKKLLKKVAEG